MAIQSALLANGDNTLITVPGGKRYAILTIMVCNTSDAVDGDFTMYFVPDTGPTNTSTMVVNQMPMPAQETFTFDTEKLILEEGDKIILNSSGPTYSILNATVSFMEV
jgi:hypothetical protein